VLKIDAFFFHDAPPEAVVATVSFLKTRASIFNHTVRCLPVLFSKPRWARCKSGYDELRSIYEDRSADGQPVARCGHKSVLARSGPRIRSARWMAPPEKVVFSNAHRTANQVCYLWGVWGAASRILMDDVRQRICGDVLRGACIQAFMQEISQRDATRPAKTPVWMMH